MKLKSRIHKLFSNKSLSIPLIVIFSVFMFVANAFAGGCNGDSDCLTCSQMNHRHVADPHSNPEPFGCQPQTPNSACGIATSRIIDSPVALVSAVKAGHHQESGMPAGPANRFNENLFSDSILSSDYFSVVTDAPPIYLLNLALLC
jgi:hypothetical protein